MSTTLRTKLALWKSRIGPSDLVAQAGYTVLIALIIGISIIGGGFDRASVIAFAIAYVIFTGWNLVANPYRRDMQDRRDLRIKQETARHIVAQFNHALAEVGSGFELEFEVNPDDPDRYILSLYRLEV